jgi:hypothetical protein
MELHENRNNTSTTQPTHPESIAQGCVAPVKDRLCELCIPKVLYDCPVTIDLQEYHNDDDQEQRDKADGDESVCLLHILNNIIRERIEIRIGHALKAIRALELVLFVLKGSFKTINAGAIVLRNQS